MCVRPHTCSDNVGRVNLNLRNVFHNFSFESHGPWISAESQLLCLSKLIKATFTNSCLLQAPGARRSATLARVHQPTHPPFVTRSPSPRSPLAHPRRLRCLQMLFGLFIFASANAHDKAWCPHPPIRQYRPSSWESEWRSKHVFRVQVRVRVIRGCFRAS